MSSFITNDSKVNSLKNRIRELIKVSEELKFLVGFFYFSGIREFYESLKNNPNLKLKILVGLTVDKINHKLIEVDYGYESTSVDDIIDKFFDSVKKTLNTDNFDQKEFYEQILFFVNLIKEGRLEIRKTLKSNHAKLYLFKLNKKQVATRELFIVGSSNLTKAGLEEQEEFNVEISDYGFEDAEKYFDELWEKSIEITEKEENRDELINVVENETLIKKITPFEAFVFVLKHYFDSFKKKDISSRLKKILEEKGYKAYNYQLDAVKQALAIIEKNNGVIIADVVGLGKSIIACSIAKELDKRGLVICPPALIGDENKKNSGWQKYINDFELDGWEIRSSGDLKNVINLVKSKKFDVVIVDEAHKFKNEQTETYEYLKNICRNKTVILLTATPFNNHIDDILSLLKLFIIPKRSTITLESDLESKFRKFSSEIKKIAGIEKALNSNNEMEFERVRSKYIELFNEESGEFERDKVRVKITERMQTIAKQVRDIIEPIIIRRNRIDLQKNPEYKNEVNNLSVIEDPQEWFYDLRSEQLDFYDVIIEEYFADLDSNGRFKGAIYRPFEYENDMPNKNKSLNKDDNFEYLQQRNLYNLMRRLMVKRFESSFGAFKKSIENFKKVNEKVLDFIEKNGKYILDRKYLDKIHDEPYEIIEELLKEYSDKKYIEQINKKNIPKNNKVYDLNKFKFKNKFLNDIKSDIKLFEEILNRLNELGLLNNDPKINCLINNIKEKRKLYPKRKIIIFSEYKDTIEYLEPILKKEFNNRVLTVNGKLDSNKLNEIIDNFDASVNEQLQKDEYDILLTTDKLSEGFNLNRAGMVINYDIPWNPVRVIQRIGRINRIGKKVFEKLFVVNFFPTERGAEYVRSREIAEKKMFLIHNTLGEDAKIFSVDEKPTASELYKKLNQNPDKLEEESFYTRILNEFLSIKNNYPKVVEAVKRFPSRIKTAKKYNENELLVFIKKNRIYVYNIKYDNNDNKKVYSLSFEEAFDKIKCKEKEKRLELTNQFWDYYEKVRDFNVFEGISTKRRGVEEKAESNLKTLLNLIKQDKSEFELIKEEYEVFLRSLLDDISCYGTLASFTLRRISGWKFDSDKEREELLKELKQLKDWLGENYLEKIKKQRDFLKKEIIVAIENQK